MKQPLTASIDLAQLDSPLMQQHLQHLRHCKPNDLEAGKAAFLGFLQGEIARRSLTSGSPAEPLTDAQLDRIARSYFAEEYAQQHVKNAIHDAFMETGRGAGAAAKTDHAPARGVMDTVGDMVRNLLTLDQSAPIFAAFHVDIDGQRRCRTKGVTISRERVIDGKWVDSSRKDVPYAHVVWAKPDERIESASAAGAGEDPIGDFQRAAREAKLNEMVKGWTEGAAGAGSDQAPVCEHCGRAPGERRDECENCPASVTVQDERAFPALMRQAVASVASNVDGEVRVNWMRPERVEAGTLLYCAADQVRDIAHPVQDGEKDVRVELPPYEVVAALNSLRWMLNKSDECDKPNMRATTLLDKHHSKDGKTIRQNLEILWRYFDPNRPEMTALLLSGATQQDAEQEPPHA